MTTLHADRKTHKLDGVTWIDRYISRYLHTKEDRAFFAMKHTHLAPEIATPAILAYIAMVTDNVALFMDIINYLQSPGPIIDPCRINETLVDEFYHLPFRIGGKCFEALLQVARAVQYPLANLTNIFYSQINHGVNVEGHVNVYTPATWRYGDSIKKNAKRMTALCGKSSGRPPRGTKNATLSSPLEIWDKGNLVDRLETQPADAFFIPRGWGWIEKYVTKRIVYEGLTLSDMLMLAARGYITPHQGDGRQRGDRVDVPMYDTEATSYLRCIYDDAYREIVMCRGFGERLRVGILTGVVSTGMQMPEYRPWTMPTGEKVRGRCHEIAAAILAEAINVTPKIYPPLVAMISLIDGMTMKAAVALVADFFNVTEGILSIFDDTSSLTYTDVTIITRTAVIIDEEDERDEYDDESPAVLVHDLFEHQERYRPSRYVRRRIYGPKTVSKDVSALIAYMGNFINSLLGEGK